MINPILFGGTDSASSAHAHGSAARAQTAASGARRDVAHLEDRLERLSLVCMAMWSLLQDKAKLSEEELLERVRLIDTVDGVKDGKATRGISKCSACGRTMSPRHRKCIYCGQGRLASSAFDAI